jgi:hypothetical protein
LPQLALGRWRSVSQQWRHQPTTGHLEWPRNALCPATAAASMLSGNALAG